MSNDYAVHVALLMLDLHIPESNSLKTKRRVLKSIKDRIRGRFNVSFAELGDLDKWQRAVCGAVMIGNDKPFLDQGLQGVLAEVQSHHEVQIISSELHFL